MAGNGKKSVMGGLGVDERDSMANKALSSNALSMIMTFVTCAFKTAKYDQIYRFSMADSRDSTWFNSQPQSLPIQL